MEPAEAVTVLLALGAALNLLVLLERHDARWSRLPPLMLPALPGLALGARGARRPITRAAPGRRRRGGDRGGALAAAPPRGGSPRAGDRGGLPQRRAHHVDQHQRTADRALAGGHGLSPAEFRATLAAAFLALNVAGWAVLGIAGDATVDVGELLVLLGLVLVGHVLGAFAFRRLDHERFYRVVLVLVLVTGAASVVAGLA